MSNIIDSIQVSGVTYTLSAETSGGGITSGEVQTMIDESISGKVNVSDNQVEAYGDDITNTLSVTMGQWNYPATFYFPAQNSAATYSDGIYKIGFSYNTRYNGWAFLNDNSNFIIVDSADTEVETVSIPNNMYLYNFSEGVTGTTFTIIGEDHRINGNFDIICKEGYRFKYLYIYLDTDEEFTYRGVSAYSYSKDVKYPSYQSAEAIENNVYPKFDEIDSGKTDVSAFTEFSGSVMTSLGGKVDASGITSSITSASTDSQIPTAKAVYDAIPTGGGGNPTVELTQAEYDALVSAGTVSADTYYIITDATPIDISNYWTSAQTQSAITESLSDYVTTNTAQDITGVKTFVNSDKPIIFKQSANTSKIGFSLRNTASTNNEVAGFEFRPNTYTDSSSVSHPLLYFGHYRNTATANNGIVQTMVGFRQYDKSGSAAYHYLIPLPAEAKTPFSLTTSFKNYFAPLGFKNGSTMITTDNTGVADFSTVLGGLKLVKLSQAEYDALSPNYDNNTLYVIT